MCRHPGMLAEQFAAQGPRLHLYDYAEKHWECLMNWQHATMYLFFGLAAAMSLVVHGTGAAPVALDRMMLALAFFTEGEAYFFRGGREEPSAWVGRACVAGWAGGLSGCVWPICGTTNSSLILHSRDYAP